MPNERPFLRSFPHHPGERWYSLEEEEQKMIEQHAQYIVKHLEARIAQDGRAELPPAAIQGLVDVCCIKLADRVAEEPNATISIPTFADALYHLGFQRGGGDWRPDRLWNRAQRPWSARELLEAHERHMNTSREKRSSQDIREKTILAELSNPNFYLMAVDTQGAYAGEGTIADNCVDDYRDRRSSEIYSIRRKWEDTSLSIDERKQFITDLCIFVTKKGNESKKTAGVAAVIRALAVQAGRPLDLVGSVSFARRMGLDRVKQEVLAPAVALMEKGEQLALDIDMPVMTIEVPQKGVVKDKVLQALAPRNVPVRLGHPHYAEILDGLGALRRHYHSVHPNTHLGFSIADLFDPSTVPDWFNVIVTSKGFLRREHAVTYLRDHPEVEIVDAHFHVTPSMSIEDLQFLDSRGASFDMSRATEAQQQAIPSSARLYYPGKK